MLTLQTLVADMATHQTLTEVAAEAQRRATQPRITQMASGIMIAMLAACPLAYVVAFTAGTKAGW